MSMKIHSLSRIHALTGFSLIELLMAAVIASSAAALLIGVLVSANQGASFRMKQAVGTQVLASQLALLAGPLTPTTPLQGSCVTPPSGWRWKLDHTPTATSSLQKVVLTVEEQGKSLHVSTYRRMIEQQEGR